MLKINPLKVEFTIWIWFERAYSLFISDGFDKMLSNLCVFLFGNYFTYFKIVEMIEYQIDLLNHFL